MNKLAIFCFIALAVLSRTTFASPICSNLVDTSRELISRLFLSLAVGDESVIQKALIDFEAQLKDLRLCSSYLSSSVYVEMTSQPATCQLVMADLLENVQQFWEKGTTDETETIQMLRYLMEKSSVFSTVCKLNTQPKRTRGTPAPECLSQIYQALSTLYSVGVDAMNQDATSLQSDFENLTPITSNINDLCGQQIILDNTKPGDGNCNNDITEISNIMSSYKSGDPTDPSNVLQTLQDLWSIYPNFKSDCITPKQVEPTVSVLPAGSTPECLSEIYQTLSTLYSVGVDAMNQDATDLESDFQALQSVTSDINTLCGQEIAFDNGSQGDGNCDNDFTTISNIMKTYSNGSPIDPTNVLQTLQSLWSAYPSFKSDCITSKTVKPADSNESPLKNVVSVQDQGASEKCLEIYGNTMTTVLEIFKSAGTNDFEGLSANFRNLGSHIFEINSNCAVESHVHLFSEMGVAQISCKDATSAMRDIFTNLDLARSEVVQKVWDMRESLLYSC